MEVLVSFIVPVYQSDKYLRTCIDSLLSQDFKGRYEILLLDFGSRDSSTSLCKEYEKKNPDVVRFLRCDINYGVSATRNLGILWSRGEYVSFVDSDDVLRKDFLSRLYPLARKEDLDVVSAGYYLLRKNKAKKGYSRINAKGNGRFFLEKLYFDIFLKTRTFVWGKLFKRSLLVENRILFPTEVQSFEDLPFYYHVLLVADRIHYLKTPLYYYRQSEESLTKRTHLFLKTHLKSFLLGKKLIENLDPVLYRKIFRKKRLAITLQFRYDSHLDVLQGRDRNESKKEYQEAVKTFFPEEGK